jgi:hypothetical protein
MKRTLPLLALALLGVPRLAEAQTASPTSAPAAVAAALPKEAAGIFDVVFVNSSGQQQGGRLVIKAAGDGYEGTIAPDGAEAFAFPSVAFEKDSAVFRIAPPGAPGDVTFHVKFDGPSLSGRFEGLENGQITGKKIR